MRRTPLFAALLPLACVAALSGPSPASAAASCDKVAATTGNDGAGGSAQDPYRTVQRLADSLAPGQVGCVRGGTYREDVTVSRARVTLTSYPQERATVVGRLWVQRGADGAVLTGLALDGRNPSVLPSPTINADDVQLVADDITNGHTAICVSVGSSTWGRAHRTIIRGNRIHDCGALPATNYDHGIYVAAADDTQILDNVIVDNADRGVQLYPDAQRTLVRGNIIDGNGEGVLFSGASGLAASGTVVEGNVISNARIRADVESWYPAGNPIGTDNVVSGNCVWNGAGGTIGTQRGFVATDNVVADPRFVARSAGDFRLGDASPCASILARSLAPAGLDWQRPLAAGVPAPAPGTPAPPATGTAPPASASPAPAPRAGRARHRATRRVKARAARNAVSRRAKARAAHRRARRHAQRAQRRHKAQAAARTRARRRA